MAGRSAGRGAARTLEFDPAVYDLAAVANAAREFGLKPSAMASTGGGRISVRFTGGSHDELEFKNLALLRTIEETRSR
jgi:hypothetical protein